MAISIEKMDKVIRHLIVMYAIALATFYIIVLVKESGDKRACRDLPWGSLVVATFMHMTVVVTVIFRDNGVQDVVTYMFNRCCWGIWSIVAFAHLNDECMRDHQLLAIAVSIDAITTMVGFGYWTISTIVVIFHNAPVEESAV